MVQKRNCWHVKINNYYFNNIFVVVNTDIYHNFKLSYAMFSPDQANECLNNL